MNTSQTNSAYTTGNTQQTIPNLPHRFISDFDVTNAGHVLEQIYLLTSRATSLLDQINPDHIYGTTQCVKLLLDDIFSIVEAHYDSTKGCYYSINLNSEADIIYIGEGLATCAAVYDALAKPVVCAFDAGNLIHVAKRIKREYPNAEIILLADNDLEAKSKT